MSGIIKYPQLRAIEQVIYYQEEERDSRWQLQVNYGDGWLLVPCVREAFTRTDEGLVMMTPGPDSAWIEEDKP